MKISLLIFLLIVIGLTNANFGEVTRCRYVERTQCLQLFCDKQHYQPNMPFYDFNRTSIYCERFVAISTADVEELVFLNCKRDELPDLSAFKNLDSLYIANMDLKKLDTESLAKLPLQSIHAQNNKLSADQQFGKLKNIRDLNLSNNLIKAIPDDFNSLTFLENLYLVNTKLEKINPNAFKDLTKLKRLDFSQNKLTEFNMNIFARSFSNLWEIKLKNNKITHLEQVYRDMYPKFEELFLSGNPLYCDHYEEFLTIGGFNGNLQLSDELEWCNYNKDPDLFSIIKINNNPNITNVCIEKPSKIANVFSPRKQNALSNDFRGTHVENCLYDQELKALKLICFKDGPNVNYFEKNAQEFHCADTIGIPRTKPSAKVESIKFLNCKMTDLPNLSSYKSLTVLNVAEMELQNLHTEFMKDLSMLTELNAAKNNLTVHPKFVGGHKIKKIDLSFNSLKTIPDNCYNSMKSLDELNLANNQLENIHKDAFKDLELLKLDMSSNKLNEIDLNILNSSNLTLSEVNLNDNPIKKVAQIKRETFQYLILMSLMGSKVPCSDLETVQKTGEFTNLSFSNKFPEIYTISEINKRLTERKVCIDKSKK